jgi:hypothetical protein
MIQGTKETIERFYLMILKDQISGLPVEEPLKEERPDFVWPHLKEPLGIEITRLFKDVPKGRRPMQVQESETTAIVQTACGIYEQRNLPNLDMRVIFGNNEIKKSDRTVLAGKLVDVVQKYLPVPNSWVAFHNDFRDDSPLPEEISYLSIARLDSLKSNHWSVSDAGWVQEDFTIELQRRINEKNIELPDYLKKCSRCWLLVAADSVGPSSFFDPSEDTKQHFYYSLFHRTFFMEAFTRKVIELKTLANAV